MFHEDHISLVVPEPKPFRLFGHHCVVFHPHPQAKVFDRSEARLVFWVFGLILVVDVLQEKVFVVESCEIPPSPVVVSWGTEVLDDYPLSKVSKDVVSKWTPPGSAFLIYSNSHVW